MDEPKKGLETVQMNVREVLAQEDARHAEAMETILADEPAQAHDGRFGEHFDDELSIGGIVYVAIGIAGVTLLGFLVSLLVYNSAVADYGQPTPSAALGAPAALPGGPLLQRSPEEELREMRREVHERLHGYGWADEGAGTVYIPIEKAIDLVVEDGLPPAAPAPPPVEPEEAAP